MGKFTVEVDDEVEEKFRKTVADVKGFHKGMLGVSVEEALEEWIGAQDKRKQSRGGR